MPQKCRSVQCFRSPRAALSAFTRKTLGNGTECCLGPLLTGNHNEADPARHVYLVASGRVRVNGGAANPRDGIAITGESSVTIEAGEDAELVLVDAR